MCARWPTELPCNQCFWNICLISLGPGCLRDGIYLSVVKIFKMEAARCTQESADVCILSTLQDSINATQTRNCCCNCSGLQRLDLEFYKALFTNSSGPRLQGFIINLILKVSKHSVHWEHRSEAVTFTWFHSLSFSPHKLCCCCF